MDVLQSALAKAKQAARTRPLKQQLAQNDAFIQRSQKRIAQLDRERATEQELLDQALIRQEQLKTGNGSCRISANRSSYAGVQCGGVIPQSKGGQIGSGTNPASSSRVCRCRRKFAEAVDEAQNGELFRGQHTHRSTRPLLLVGVEAVGVARCPRRSRHGMSQSVDGIDFQRRFCAAQLESTVDGGSHGALSGCAPESPGMGSVVSRWGSVTPRSATAFNHQRLSGRTSTVSQPR